MKPAMTYRGYEITEASLYAKRTYKGAQYEYAHQEYDGAPDANDDRHGYASTLAEAKELIDDLEDE